MGDISIKGQSPLLNKSLKNFRILNKERKEKDVVFEPKEAKKPKPIEDVRRPRKQRNKQR